MVRVMSRLFCSLQHTSPSLSVGCLLLRADEPVPVPGRGKRAAHPLRALLFGEGAALPGAGLPAEGAEAGEAAGGGGESLRGAEAAV
jgi:hypothetical protein